MSRISKLMEDLESLRGLVVPEDYVQRLEGSDEAEPGTEELPEDPLHGDEDEALKGALEDALGGVMVKALGEHLAKEYAGRPEDITPPTVMGYMDQLQEIVTGLFSDRSWLNDVGRAAEKYAKDGSHQGSAG